MSKEQDRCSDKEAAEYLRKWVSDKSSMRHPCFAWPTDSLGYHQHIRFVKYRNSYKGDETNFNKFVLTYADKLEKGEIE